MLDASGDIQTYSREISVALGGDLSKFTRGEYITLISNISGNQPLNGATLNIYSDVVGGTVYTGKYKYHLEGQDLQFGYFIGDYYVCDNSTGSEVLVYESDSFSTSGYAGVAGNVDSTGTTNTRYSNNVVYVQRGGYNVSGYVPGICGAKNLVDTNDVCFNTVYFEGNGNAVGGYGDKGSNIYSNTVIIKNNTNELYKIYGGYAFCYSGGNAGGNSYESGNKVYITTAKFSDAYTTIYGGRAMGGSADFNTVEIGRNGGIITGGWAQVYGGNAPDGEANNNTVVLYSGKYRGIYGGAGRAADGNSVEISGIIKGNAEAINKIVVGGNGSSYSADNNEVYLKNVSCSGTGNIYGGYSSGNNGGANNNLVQIEAWTNDDNVNVYGGYAERGNANNNTVLIKGGNFGNANVKIVGGATEAAGKTTDNNTIDITGGTFGSNVILVGGQSTSVGNKLEYRISGETFNSVYDFQEMNFYLPVGTDVTGNTALMTVTNKVTVDALVNVYNSNNIALAKGNIITLIHDTSGNKFQDTFGNMRGGNVLGHATNISGTKFVNQYAELGFDDDVNPTKLQVKIVSDPMVTTDTEVLKAPVEGIAAATQSVNTVTDLVSNEGIANMTQVTANSGTAESFGATNIGKSRLDSGSHVDVIGYALVAGVAQKVVKDNGDKVTGGVFFEYGNSKFDTYQDCGYHGEGASISKGGGVLWKYDNIHGSYYEGMLHAGRVTTNWSSKVLNGGYETSSVYYGGSATYGYKIMLDEDNQVRLYTTYMYGHTAGSEANVGGSNYSFDSVKSHRTRLGVRYMHSDMMEHNKVRPYIGFAWEHEFNGEARANVTVGTLTSSAPSPTMKGNTGIMELGCSWDTGKWTVTVGGEMFIGKRRGWNGMLSATYNF